MLAIIELLRPKQWVKNGFVLAPLIFSLQFDNITAWQNALFALLAFICASGAVYILNDISDREADRCHPEKKNRPLADGRVSLPGAIFFMVLILAIGAFITFQYLPRICAQVLMAYFVINIIYSKWLKHVAIMDVSLIAVGFVLRVLMGAYAISVSVSPWIVLSTFLLALFIGFGKRLHEIKMSPGKTRKSLGDYNPDLLDKLINVSCATALISYAIYAAETAQSQGKTELVYTVFFVAFGLFRYLQFLYFNKQGGSPEEILIGDRLFIGNLLAWLAVTLWILA